MILIAITVPAVMASLGNRDDTAARSLNSSRLCCLRQAPINGRNRRLVDPTLAPTAVFGHDRDNYVAALPATYPSAVAAIPPSIDMTM